MNEQKNVQVVKDAYAAFGRKDIPSLIGTMADNIDWQVYGTDLPMSGQRKGKAEVTRFFQQVDETWNFERFEPREFIAQGDIVVSLGAYNGTSKPAGKPFASEFAHVFTVRSGKIDKFREYADTHNLVGAYSGATVKV